MTRCLAGKQMAGCYLLNHLGYFRQALRRGRNPLKAFVFPAKCIFVQKNNLDGLVPLHCAS